MNQPGRELPGPIGVIMAAGKGTRMRSDKPKVIHPIGGRPMVCCVVDACREAGCTRVILIVGYRQEEVREAIASQGEAWAKGIEFAVQAEQLGTGHAVICAKETIGPAGLKPLQPIFVLAGDGPLIRGSTLRALLDVHERHRASATLATSIIPDPTGYGRIVRDRQGRFSAIVEHKECSPEQLGIREVNPSYYCFAGAALFSALDRVNRQPNGEYYLTDVPALMLAEDKRVELIDAVPPEDVLSINTPEQLAEVDAIYRARHASRGQIGGVQ